ncbi:RAMP superfamily CRISPR-associated protein [Propionivibrio sp.]|uniref:RAMP superfamily CRISPR-associated protein n=1 Tax=Propionivibrio sp. TaxID=2212460 RepID=UPI003BF3AE61
MSRTLHTITLSVTLQAPYLVHGNDAGRFGLDATLLFDHLDRPIIPGTLLAGRIAEAWRSYGAQLGQPNASAWLGQADQSSNNTQQRARMQVADLVLSRINGQDASAACALHHTEVARTALDDDTGSVTQGALLITEQISDSGAALTFEGTWHTWAEAEEVKTLVQQLRAALLVQTQLGAYRGVGFGRLLDCRVNAQSAPASPYLHLPACSKLRLGLQFDAPICVNTTSRRGNVFVSGDVIPGSTLLGALAQTLLQLHAASRLTDITGSALAQHFDALRCTHALPSTPGGGRPMPLPQSLIAIDSEVLDVYPISVAGTFVKAPAFQTDWKSGTFKTASQDQGWRNTARHLRVRTAMLDGKAAEGQLFAYDCIYAAPATPVQWQFDLDLSAVPESAQPAVRQELAKLLRHGLGPIGKTDARAKVDVIAHAQNVWPSRLDAKAQQLKVGELVPMVLTSDALLFATDAIANQTNLDLTTLYRNAFDDLSAQAGYSDTLTLSHFFATQQLCGGESLHRRYLHQKSPAYQPLALTQAGSVFVFKVNDPDTATKLLRHWQDHGLSLPQAVQQRHGQTWRDHPYIAQNGYGEVVVQATLPFKAL